MIGFMPELYPDELVYSWLARYHVRTGHHSYQQTAKHLLNKKANIVSKKFLNEYSDEFFDMIKNNITIKELAIKHSMLSTYVKFLPIDKRNNIIKSYENNLRYKESSIGFKTKSNGINMRYCPICIKEDRDKYGETYWHREHQFIGINVCTKHKCYLIDSEVSVQSIDKSEFYTAEYIIGQKNDVKISSNEFEINFAKYFTEVINTESNNDSNITGYLNTVLWNSKYKANGCKVKDFNKLYNDYFELCEKINANIISSRPSLREILKNKCRTLDICILGMLLNISPYDLVNRVLSSTNKKNISDQVIFLRDVKKMSYDRIAKELNASKRTVERIYHNRKVECDFDILELLQNELPKFYNGHLTNGRPQKITVGTIEKQFDIPQKILISNKFYHNEIIKYDESYPEYWARELVWSYNKLKEDKAYISQNKITKQTSIFKDQFIRAIPHISKYTDKETAEAIEALLQKS